MVALAINERGVSLFFAVPVVVTIHGVVTAGNAGDLADAQLIQLSLQIGQEALARVGVRVTAIGDAVEVDLLGTHVLGHFQHAEPVVCVAVDATGAHQAHQVDGLAGVNGSFHVLDQDRVLEHLAILDGFGDEGELLVHDAACAHVGVADFRVAHLTIGQANSHAGSFNGGHGVLCHQCIEVGLFGCDHGVAIGLVGGPAKAIHNAKQDRFLGHMFYLLVVFTEKAPGTALETRRGRALGKLWLRKSALSPWWLR